MRQTYDHLYNKNQNNNNLSNTNNVTRQCKLYEHVKYNVTQANQYEHLKYCYIVCVWGGGIGVI